MSYKDITGLVNGITQRVGGYQMSKQDQPEADVERVKTILENADKHNQLFRIEQALKKIAENTTPKEPTNKGEG